MEMIFRLSACLIFSLYNCYTDWKHYKIWNKAILLFAGIALICSFLMGGISDVLGSLAGMAIMLVLFPLFALRMLGAGDIKALMAIGLMLKYPFALYALCGTFLASGVIALILSIFRKNARERFKTFFYYLANCLRTLTLASYTTAMDSQDQSTFRFSYGIALGIFILLLYQIWLTIHGVV